MELDLSPLLFLFQRFGLKHNLRKVTLLQWFDSWSLMELIRNGHMKEPLWQIRVWKIGPYVHSFFWVCSSSNINRETTLGSVKTLARFHPCKEECSPCPSFKGGTQKPAGAFRLVLLQKLFSGTSPVCFRRLFDFSSCLREIPELVPTYWKWWFGRRGHFFHV